MNKLDQWLRDHDLLVIRDCQFFVAGATLQDNIRRAVASSDKILAVLSSNSSGRDWPLVERQLAEQVEARLGAPVLIYVCLDDTPLPAPSSRAACFHRIHNARRELAPGREVLMVASGSAITRSEPRDHSLGRGE